jgi:hypothetical protein
MNSRYRALTLTLGLIFTATANAEQPADSRINLGFTAEESAVLLADMRNMLVSIQGILQGIGANDRTAIAAAARLSGNQMARTTPASIRAKVPKSFKDIGGPTHLAFEDIALRAETDEMDALARQTAEVMNQCAVCHAQFRVR